MITALGERLWFLQDRTSSSFPITKGEDVHPYAMTGEWEEEEKNSQKQKEKREIAVANTLSVLINHGQEEVKRDAAAKKKKRTLRKVDHVTQDAGKSCS